MVIVRIDESHTVHLCEECSDKLETLIAEQCTIFAAALTGYCAGNETYELSPMNMRIMLDEDLGKFTKGHILSGIY